MYACCSEHAHAPIEMCVSHGEFAKSVVSANTPARQLLHHSSVSLSPPASQIGRLALQIGIAKVTQDTPAPVLSSSSLFKVWLIPSVLARG